MFAAIVLAIALVAVSSTAAAQEPAAPDAPDLLRVYLDCGPCDSAHLRQTVGFVDYVLDRRVADVHVLVTIQPTGGGGLSWRVAFIDTAAPGGDEQTLSFDTPSTATDDERRDAFARVFKLGLASRAAATRAAPRLNVTWTPPETTDATTPEQDPWNYWVFNTRVSGFTNGERSSSSISRNLFMSANRTTDRLKLNIGASGNAQESRFELDDETVRSRRNSWGANGRVVASLDAHWSVGATGSVSHSSFSNLDRAIAIAPAIEFNVFPYSESSRRSLTLHYAIGVLDHRYTEPTIYDRLRETIPRHAIGAALSLEQPWGTLSVSSRFSQHLGDLGFYRGSIASSTDVRLFKGFSFNVFGEYERIKDQVSLRKADLSDQEVLLRLQQQATGYSYYLSFGITYRFGSIFNNVVNTRFNESVF